MQANWPGRRWIVWVFVLSCPMLIAADAVTDDLLDARRDKVAAMSDTEKQQLLRKAERFAALDAKEQERLRQLHAELEQDPENAPQLRQVLTRYHEWLTSLSPGQRAELLELSPDARVTKIKELQQQQASRLAREKGLVPRDLKRVITWLEDVSWQRREQFLKAMPEHRRARLEKEKDEQELRRQLAFMALGFLFQPGQGESAITAEERQQLIDKLSPEARAQFEKVTDPDQQRKVIQSWLQAALRHQWESRGSGRRIAQEDLERFFEHDLSVEEREKLLNLPPDAMQ